MNSNNRYPAEIIAGAQRWTGSFLLKSLDGNRTAFAKRKAGRGIRLVTRNQLSVIARTVSNEALPLRAYDIARNARSWSAER